jgi:hypothetical protein
MSLRIYLGLPLLLSLGVALAPAHVFAQDAAQPPEKHGRKYKAPPETSHIEVTVIKASNLKPISSAAVIFHPVKDGHDEGNLEIKTDPDGKAVIDVIPTGSSVRVQVLADGFATFAEDYEIKESTRHIQVLMLRPRSQISTYQNNEGKASQMQPGVQEPIRPKPKAKGTPVDVPTPPVPAPTTSPEASPAPSASPN